MKTESRFLVLVRRLIFLTSVGLFQICFAAISAADPSPARCPIPDQSPKHLSQTCFTNLVRNSPQIPTRYSNFFEFEPRYPAYSDGAAKRRWIFIPEATQVVTQDLDNWVFPPGTVAFKEFTVGGVKIETRVLEKVAPGFGANSWRFSNYAWRVDQTDADLVNNSFYNQTPEELRRYSAAEIQNQFKISLPQTCFRCHSGAADVINGFNYLQLSSTSKGFGIFDAGRAGILSHVPTALDSIQGSEMDRKAIGYVQSNCAICHTSRGPGEGDFSHSYTATSLETENFMVTANTAGLLVKGNPAQSHLFRRFSSGSMPKVKPVNQDKEGVELLRSWILQLK